MVPAKFIEAKPKQDQNQKKSLSSAFGERVKLEESNFKKTHREYISGCKCSSTDKKIPKH